MARIQTVAYSRKRMIRSRSLIRSRNQTLNHSLIRSPIRNLNLNLNLTLSHSPILNQPHNPNLIRNHSQPLNPNPLRSLNLTTLFHQS